MSENYFDFDKFDMMDGEFYDTLRLAVQCGYNPEDAMPMIEEDLTINQATVAWAFFKWLHENNKTFGWNLVSVFSEFYDQATQEHKDMIDGKTEDPELDISKVDITKIVLTDRKL